MTGDGLGRGLSDMWRSVLLFIPAALAFVAILLIGYLLARLLRTAVGKGLRRTGFDNAVAGRFLRGGITASDLCAKIVFYGVLLFALQLAFGVWGPNPVSDLLTALIAWLPRAFVAIVIIVVAAAIAGAVNDLITGALGGLSYGRLLGRAVSIVIVALGVIAALDQVRIATSVTQPVLIAVLATVAGVVIVGVGGGLVRPMQARWEGWLDRAGEEAAAIRSAAAASAAAAAADREARAQAAAFAAGSATTSPAADETQVIPPPRAAGTTSGGSTAVTDPAAGETTTVIESGSGDTTTVIESGSGDTTTVISSAPADTTIVISGGSDEIESTQVIPPADKR